MVRTAGYRSSKYSVKLDGDVSKNRADAYAPQQKKIFKLSQGEQVNIERVVKTMTNDLYQLSYIIFAKELVKVSKLHKGENLFNEMWILQNKWVSRGLNPDTMDAIKEHFVQGYPETSFFILDWSLLDGTDVLA